MSTPPGALRGGSADIPSGVPLTRGGCSTALLASGAGDSDGGTEGSIAGIVGSAAGSEAAAVAFDSAATSADRTAAAGSAGASVAVNSISAGGRRLPLVFGFG
ncbi:MAG: hypothetical protein K2P80_00620 [Beijerinckiaceae bacterium]|nr:hypothetical protein [Beijerinckiaceae bacterium]